jgi:hypothetical protein
LRYLDAIGVRRLRDARGATTYLVDVYARGTGPEALQPLPETEPPAAGRRAVA